MALLVSVALFGLLATALTAYGYGRYAKPARLLRQLDTEGTAVVTLDRIGQPRQSALQRRVEAIGKHAPVSTQDAQTARRTLMAAGYRKESAVALFYGIKVIMAVTLAILSIVFRDSVTANKVLRIVLPIAATVAGYWLPGFVLERKVTKRREKLRLSLPDGLDLMVVSVEAGLGLDQAIQNVDEIRQRQQNQRVVSERLCPLTRCFRHGGSPDRLMTNIRSYIRIWELCIAAAGPSTGMRGRAALKIPT